MEQMSMSNADSQIPKGVLPDIKATAARSDRFREGLEREVRRTAGWLKAVEGRGADPAEIEHFRKLLSEAEDELAMETAFGDLAECAAEYLQRGS